MRNLQLDELALFARAAELGSLSAVARERDVPVSQVSRTLARLEKACGARLMHRSTHGLALTEEGRTFLDYSKRAVAALDELEGEFAERAGEPRGIVRVAASTVIAQYQVLPSLHGLAQRHPRLTVELEVGDRMVDMAREGVDIAIRTVVHLPETVVARQLGVLGRALYAAPDYVAQAGLPQHPEQLLQHRLVTNTAVPMLNDWPFVVDGQASTLRVQGQWRANDTNMAAAMVLQGLGIGRLATLAGDVLVREGRLVPVLEPYVDRKQVAIHAVTLGARHRLPKVRACIDYWAEWFAASSSCSGQRGLTSKP
jgi:DNA-binding transcriptional LysR family regulator